MVKPAAMAVLMQLCFQFVDGKSPLSTVFLLIGGLSIIIGAFGAFGQTRIKRLLAFSAVNHMGFVVVLLGLGTQAFW